MIETIKDVFEFEHKLFSELEIDSPMLIINGHFEAFRAKHGEWMWVYHYVISKGRLKLTKAQMDTASVVDIEVKIEDIIKEIVDKITRNDNGINLLS